MGALQGLWRSGSHAYLALSGSCLVTVSSKGISSVGGLRVSLGYT